MRAGGVRFVRLLPSVPAALSLLPDGPFAAPRWRTLSAETLALMDHDLARIAERLVTDFSGQVSLTTVIAVLHDCVDKHPNDPPEIIEQAAQFQLQIRHQGDSQ
jgi:hypothetical protein